MRQSGRSSLHAQLHLISSCTRHRKLRLCAMGFDALLGSPQRSACDHLGTRRRLYFVAGPSLIELAQSMARVFEKLTCIGTLRGFL
jgi:hypothetical protein